MQNQWIVMAAVVCLLTPTLAADSPREDRERLERRHTMALRAQTVSGAPSPQVVTAPASFSLTLDGDVDLGGYVFKAGVPFIHSYGEFNTAVGLNALVSVTPGPMYSVYGNQNSAFGSTALQNNTTGFHNTANGARALFSNTEGYRNTAIGSQALDSNTTGYQNTAVGVEALQLNTTGSENTAIGSRALDSNTTGYRNTAIGSQALDLNTTGSENTAIGFQAGKLWTDGDKNIAIGYGSQGLAAESGTIRIGGTNKQQTTFIEGINDGEVAGNPVCITADDELGLCPAPPAAPSAQISPQLWEQLRRQDAELSDLRKLVGDLRRTVVDQRQRLEQLERGR